MARCNIRYTSHGMVDGGGGGGGCTHTFQMPNVDGTQANVKKPEQKKTTACVASGHIVIIGKRVEESKIDCIVKKALHANNFWQYFRPYEVPFA